MLAAITKLSSDPGPVFDHRRPFFPATIANNISQVSSRPCSSKLISEGSRSLLFSTPPVTYIDYSVAWRYRCTCMNLTRLEVRRTRTGSRNLPSVFARNLFAVRSTPVRTVLGCILLWFRRDDTIAHHPCRGFGVWVPIYNRKLLIRGWTLKLPIIASTFLNKIG